MYKFLSHGQSESVDFQGVLVGNPIHGFPHFPSIQGKPLKHSALVVTEATSDFLHQSISCMRFWLLLCHCLYCCCMAPYVNWAAKDTFLFLPNISSVPTQLAAVFMQEVDTPAHYRRTLAASTLIILFLEYWNFQPKKIWFQRTELLWRELEEYLQFFFLTWNLSNQ